MRKGCRLRICLVCRGNLQVPFLLGGDRKGGEWQEMGLLWEPDFKGLERHIALFISLCLLFVNLQYLPITSVMLRKHLGLAFKVLSGLCPVSISSVPLHTLHSSQVVFSLPIEKSFWFWLFSLNPELVDIPSVFFLIWTSHFWIPLGQWLSTPDSTLEQGAFAKISITWPIKSETVGCRARVAECFKSSQADFIVQSGLRTTVLQPTSQFPSCLMSVEISNSCWHSSAQHWA